MPDMITSDGTRLSYEERGSGQPLLLIAGYTAPSESWIFQTNDFVAAGHRVYVLDRRSHGRSDDTLYGQRMSRHGQDLLEFLTALHLTDVVIIGASMGASTMWASADLGQHPFVRGYVSVDQTPKMINEDAWGHGFYGLTAQNVGTFFAQGVPATGRGWTVEQTATRASRLLDAIGYSPPTREVNAPETRYLLRDHAIQDWRDVIARVNVPMLFIAGSDSELWPSEHAYAAASLSPFAQASVIHGAGHATNVDKPLTFNGAVLDFVARLGG